jgi:hypothetical protein
VAGKLRLDRAPVPVLIEGDARVQALQAVPTQPETPEDYVEAIARLWRGLRQRSSRLASC